MSSFLGCLSGSSELAWGFVEPLLTYEVRFSASGCARHPSLCLGCVPWVIPCFVFSWLSFLEQGCGVLCFRHGFCGEDSGPSLAPRLAGFTVPAQPTRDNRNGRLLYPVRAVRCYLVRFGCASSAMRAVPFCRKVYQEGVIEDRCLLLAPGAVVTDVLTLGHGTVCFMSLELGALVLPLHLFFVKNFAAILVVGRECGSLALPCEATWEQSLLGSSKPSTGSVW